MDTYNNDDEQVAAIKKWWQQNATSVVLGITVGVGLIVGWQAWQTHQRNAGMAASAAFAQVQSAVESKQAEPIIEAAERVIEQHPDTVYAVLAGRQAAKQAYQQGDKAAARVYLENALQAADHPTLQAAVRLQLAEVLIDLQQWQAADAVLDAEVDDAFAAEAAALRGDLAFHQGDTAAAYAAYQQAATLGGSPLLDMKIAALQPATDSVEAP